MKRIVVRRGRCYGIAAVMMVAAALPTAQAAPFASQNKQAASENARFEVATIKPGVAGEGPGIQFLVSFTRVSTRNTSVTDLLKYAYGLHADQIVGGPRELMQRGYAIQAVVSADTPTKPNADLLKTMLRNLLADRFGLVCHMEGRVLPVYLLQAVTPRLKPSEQALPMTTGGYSEGDLVVNHGAPRDLAAYLQRFVTDRPVLDQTGISGAYDMEVRFAPDDLPPHAESALAERPGLLTAVREQLGLKLTAARASTPVFVIDRVTAPTPN